MPLERADMMHSGDGVPQELGHNEPVLLRAHVPESHTVYEVVARMETVGGVFSRTMVRLVRWLALRCCLPAVACSASGVPTIYHVAIVFIVRGHKLHTVIM